MDKKPIVVYITNLTPYALSVTVNRVRFYYAEPKY